MSGRGGPRARTCLVSCSPLPAGASPLRSGRLAQGHLGRLARGAISVGAGRRLVVPTEGEGRGRVLRGAVTRARPAPAAGWAADVARAAGGQLRGLGAAASGVGADGGHGRGHPERDCLPRRVRLRPGQEPMLEGRSPPPSYGSAGRIRVGSLGGRLRHARRRGPDPGLLWPAGPRSLNRGEHRQLNRALHTIVMIREAWHEPTKRSSSRGHGPPRDGPGCARSGSGPCPGVASRRWLAAARRLPAWAPARGAGGGLGARPEPPSGPSSRPGRRGGGPGGGVRGAGAGRGPRRRRRGVCEQRGSRPLGDGSRSGPAGCRRGRARPVGL
jgi:hypothetical protein